MGLVKVVGKHEGKTSVAVMSARVGARIAWGWRSDGLNALLEAGSTR